MVGTDDPSIRPETCSVGGIGWVTRGGIQHEGEPESRQRDPAADEVKGFIVLPERWMVERTIGWLSRCHCFAKD